MESVNKSIRYSRVFFSIACACAIAVLGIKSLNPINARANAEATHSVTIGDTVSIMSDSHCLADNGGSITNIERSKITANALWVSVLADENGDSNYRRYRNVKTGNWLCISDDKKLTLTNEESLSCSFAHTWNSTYNYPNSGTAAADAKWSNETTQLHLTYNNGWTLSESETSLTFAQWHYYKNAKKVDFTIVWNQNQSKANLFEDQAGKHVLFPYAEWKTGSPLDAQNNTKGEYTAAAKAYTWGYEDEVAVFDITNPTLTTSSYYGCVATGTPAQIVESTATTQLTKDNLAENGISFAIQWGYKADPKDLTCSLMPSFSQAKTEKRYWGDYNPREQGDNLQKSAFSAEVYNQFQETAARDMMQYSYSADAPLSVSVRPVGIGPRNVCRSLSTGGPKQYDWYHYLDTLNIYATGDGVESVSRKIPVGRQEWNVWTEYELRSHSTMADVANHKISVGKDGGKYTFTIDKVEFATGIALYTASMGGTPLRFIENTDKRTDVGPNSGNTKTGYLFEYTGSGESWLQVARTDNQIVVTVPAYTGSRRTTDLTLRIKYPRPGEESNNNRAFYTYETLTFEQTNSSGQEEYAEFKPNRGKGYATFDKDGRQQVHTYETTIYYEKGTDITLKLKERNFFGYMRWYDYNSGRDPQYYTEKDGTVRTLEHFWTLFPHGIKSNQNNVLFSNLNTDPEHSKGVYLLIPDSYKYTEIKANNNTNLPSPIVHLEENLELDIACDVSNYTDYVVEKDANNQVVSLTEPTLSYRQIFHLRPAKTEEEGETEAYKAKIASELAGCTPATGKYYEKHKYVVPLGTEVNLQCDYELVRSLGAKDPDKHYWVKMDDGSYARTEANTNYWPWWYRWDDQKKQFVNQKWDQADEFNATGKGDYYKDETKSSYDYFRVKYNKDTTMLWAVWIVPGDGGTFGTKYTGKTIQLAYFEVTWSKNASALTRDTTLYGPSAIPLITKEEIARNYIMLAEQNFDFDKPGTTEPVLYSKPLPASESTYGFVYPRRVLTDANRIYKSQRRNENTTEAFPYFGEYAIINQLGTKDWNCSWFKPTSQHTGGPAEGYCLYVDGAQEAGKVVTLTTNAPLCSGQQMYCAMWLCNGAKNSNDTKPDFSVSVEGLNENGDWEEVSRYEVGEINNGGNSKTGLWRQINFPLVSTVNYSESRIVLYNYAATNSGNDFLVDDVWLYASRLPLEAFQATTECLSDQDGEDHTATVIRVDYTKLVNSFVKNNLYYQIHDNTNDSALKMNYFNPDPALYQLKDTCGMVPLPTSKDFTPSSNQTYNTLADFLSSLTKSSDTQSTHIGYVKVTENGESRWVLYIAEIVKSSLLHPKMDYEVRTAYAVEDLPSAECAMRTNLPVYERTSFLFNGETYPAKGQCANARYPLEILVRGNIFDGDQNVTLSTLARGEWLQGFDFDDVYYEAYLKGLKKPADQAAQAIADTAYKKQYGYTREMVQNAIADMRRDPDIYGKNTNYYVTNYRDLQPGENYWDNPDNYNVITDLCRRGLLRLALEKDYFYMHSQDTVRYWVFPTAKTARVQYKDTICVLNKCTSPTYLMVFSNKSDYELDLGIHRDNTPMGQVPRIRMTQSEANTRFGIPIAAIGTDVILAWDSTRIDMSGTNDPVLLSKMNDQDFSMRYTQDRIYTLLSGQDKYYKTGDTVYFTPIDQAHVNEMKRLHDENPKLYEEGHPGYWKVNSDIMRAGYEYTLRTQMRTRGGDLTDKKSEQGCWIGYSYITILVIPDTLIWTPSNYDEKGYYHWGTDENWRGYINGKVSEVGYAPLANSVVIIPDGLAANQYPYIEKENLYSTDVNYNSAICKKVQFRRGTRVLGQENLTYDQAFVDMAFQSTYWNTLSAPLQGMYSGDLFIPHSGKYNANPKNLEPTKQTGNYTQDFSVSGFQGTRTADAAYALWASYYNQSVRQFYDNGEALPVSSTTAAFVESNALDEPLRPGQGFAVAGWGPSDNAENLEIRLPKTDATYSYYDKNGNPTSHKVTLDRTNAGKLAFTPDADGTMTVTLTNQADSTEFLLGNPAMAYLDVFQLLAANTDLLQQGSFRYQKNGSWYTVSENTSNYADRFVAPMQSVMLKAKTAGKKIEIKIPKSCFAMTTEKPANTGSKAPQRANGHILNREIMHIVAYNDDNRAYTTLAAMDFAHNEYNADEDVIAISSGIEAGNQGTVSVSPMNIYTLAGTQPLAIDIRKEIGVVPLGFIIGDDYRTDSLTLYFGLNSDWESECYLCDNRTGMRQRIYNDSRIRIATPANHQLRYYIEGPAKEPQTPTDQKEITADANRQTVSAFSNAVETISVVASGDIAEVRMYDVVGRLLAQIQPTKLSPLLTLHAPTGVVLLQVKLTSGTTAETKVLVK